MKDFEKIGKKMPYDVSDEEVERIVSTATEKAIEEQKTRKPGHLRPIAFLTVAVAASLLLVFGWTWLKTPSEKMVAERVESPVDDFLDGLTDEEVDMLAYYEIEEIPEY